MILKILKIGLLAGTMWHSSTSLFAAPQQSDILKVVQLSPSTSLIVKRTRENTATSAPAVTSQLPLGVVPLSAPSSIIRPIDETYFVVLKVGEKEFNLGQSKFRSKPTAAEDSVTPRFSVYDAVLDGNDLRILLIDKGYLSSVTAHIDGSGKISELHQKAFPEAFPRIDTASFLKDKDGKVTLNIREPGKAVRAFRFNSNGDAFNVPVD